MTVTQEESLDPERLVAIIGLGGLFPRALTVAEFWKNILERRDCISEVPKSRWDPAIFYDPDPNAEDKTYCKVGGFIEDFEFDSRKFRIPPATARAMDRAHKLCLLAAAEAFGDAGLDRRDFDRSRSAVILGIGGGRLELEEHTVCRTQFPLWEDAFRRSLQEAGFPGSQAESVVREFRELFLRDIAPISEDSFAGVCPSVTAARIASYLDLHGPTYVVDSACAASLGAVDAAVDGLVARDFDLAVTGGCQAHMGPGFFVGFSKFHGLSRDRVKPFDAEADGFLLGEGAGLFVLKRLSDARRDGDRIYAVIRGIGSSSDGREKGIGAPNPKAQALAITRAFERAGYGPGSVQLVETHGAGTAVGDPIEIEAMTEVFGPSLAPAQRVAISAVKSQIGHLMGGAGAAGLMKTVLGLHHKILPPTIHHRRPNPVIPWDKLPFYVVTEKAPWPTNQPGLPRRANVSSFGFGGNNFHIALEEYDQAYYDRVLGRSGGAAPRSAVREPIALVGVAASLPQAPTAEAFWENVVGGVNTTSEVPSERWHGRVDLFFDANADAPDKTYGKLGGFALPARLDPRQFRIPPASERHLDDSQRRVLAITAAALQDAGWDAQQIDRQRTALLFADPGGCRTNVWRLNLRLGALRFEHLVRSPSFSGRLGLPPAQVEQMLSRIRREVLQDIGPWCEDSVVSVATSIGPARVCKAYDFMGTHMAVDAACGSSSAAIGLAVRGLQARKWDLVVTGGVGPASTPELHVLASRARALSGTGSRPFDETADGFVESEGVVGLVLKRLRDAVAARDRIYAVIRGVGASSDGRGHSMYAPDSGYQALAIARAYADAGYPAETVQFVECHATSTPVGDQVELETLQLAFGSGNGRRVAIGSVKSQIGHTLGAAGAASLLKVALGFHHKLLPPMSPVQNPIGCLKGEGPFYLVTEARAWPENQNGLPRRAGVNAFGFGGTNWHLAVEEYSPEYHAGLLGLTPAKSELVVASGDSLEDTLARARTATPGAVAPPRQPCRLALVVENAADLQSKLDLAAKTLRAGKRSPVLDTQGIYYGEGPRPKGKLAFLFPGQGPQYADMLRDLRERYPVVRRTMAEANEVLEDLLGSSLEDLIFTATRSAEEREALEQGLMSRSDIVQPALLTAQVALFRVLESFGLTPDIVAGHSLGEYGALVAAGVLDFQQALRVVHVRGREFRRLSEGGRDAGKMAMVSAPASVVEAELAGIPGYVTVANRNCRVQSVLSGESEAVEEAVARLERKGLECRVLPIAGAFHSKVARAIREPMAEAVAKLEAGGPRICVLSSVDGLEYEGDCRARVAANLLDQLERPVDFIGVVERLHEQGARTFVEVGPKNALTGFVSDILEGKPHTALYANHPKGGETNQMQRLLGQLFTRGFDVASLDRSVKEAPRGGRATDVSEPILITGAAVGLPGKSSRVFSDDNLERLFAGHCLIDGLSEEQQDRIVEKQITRLVKSEQGPRMEEVRDRAGAVKLAGQRGRFDLREEYGIEEELLESADMATQLAIAAGLEGLRDAGIPLQHVFRKTTTGSLIPCGWALPEPLQDETAVLFATAWPLYERAVAEAESFQAHKYGSLAAEGLRSLYWKRLSEAKSEEERWAADAWFVEEHQRLWSGRRPEPYRFKRGYLEGLHHQGNNRFAQLVKARGPNLQLNAACSSTTTAIGVGEDLIRCGRARRVIILAADDVTSGPALEWAAAGFLAVGAAATDADVEEAALPFDRRRHGMVLGMGAVCLVLETASAVRERGMRGIAELLGTRISNSASHFTRPDPEHVASEMEAFLRTMERRHGLDRRQLARQVLYMSHETFTPAGAGIAETEVYALKRCFGEDWREVTVVNTKAMTGHPQGAGIEDAIALKALQWGKLPPVLHHKEPDPLLEGVKLSRGGSCDLEYGLRFSAGVGSQVAMSLSRVVCRGAERVADRSQYQQWIAAVSGLPGAELEVVNRTLRIREALPAVAKAAPPRPEVVPEAKPAVGPPAAPPPSPAAVVPTGVTTGDIEETILSLVSEKTGYERELLDLDLDLEGDLGIDTIKQAQVLAVLREKYDLPREEGLKIKDFPTLRRVIEYIASRTGARQPQTPALAAVPPARTAAQEIEETVLALVSEKTGYERELLDLDLDLEGDLGIDTIKQAQVLAVLREKYDLPREEGLKIKDFPTLRRVIEYLASRLEAAPATPPPPPAETSPAQEIEETVLALVSEKTGYERELLDLDLDLEADLGIDTIKQAQVMAVIREKYQLPQEQGLKIKDFPTLRHVIKYIASRAGGPAPASGARPQPEPRRGIRRLAVTAEPCPLSGSEPVFSIGRGWPILLTDDGRGVAAALRRTLEARGARVAILKRGLRTYEKVRDAITRARKELGPIRGLIHLAPLGDEPALHKMDAADWRATLANNVQSCFYAAKEIREDLSLLVAATALGGRFGLDDADGAALRASSGGVAGLVKSIAHEMPQVRVKVVDFEPPQDRSDAERIAAELEREIERGGARVETGYQAETRFAPRLTWEPVDLSREPQVALEESSVVLLAGGGRGITAEIAKDLARRFRPLLVLLGRSELPPNIRELAALDEEGLKALRQQITRERKQQDSKITPARIEREFHGLLGAIEIQQTLEAIQSAGGRAVYRACDVRDGERTKAVLTEVQKTIGCIQGVVFGAGIIEDKLLEDKALDSFDRVFGVKAEGVFHLARSLDWKHLQFFVSFSSVAGRFGNRGQTDYAAGNELLNKFTSWLQATHPETRCTAMGWTAWDRVGLAARSGSTAFLESHGLEVLQPEAGVAHFRHELLYGCDTREVLITGDLGPFDRDGLVQEKRSRPAAISAPFLDEIVEYRRGAELTALRTLDPARDRWLSDHVIDGTPLLPGVLGVEIMAEAAKTLFPGFHFAGVEDLRILLAVKILKGRAVTLRIRAQGDTAEREDRRRVAVTIESDFVGEGKGLLVQGRRHYQANVILSRTTPQPVPSQGPNGSSGPLTLAAEAIYGPGAPLPHGALFRVLSGLQTVSDNGAVGAVASFDEQALGGGLQGRRLETLPLAREAAFQVAGLWELLKRGTVGLPYGCRRVEHFGYPPEGMRLVARVTARPNGSGPIEYDTEIIGEDGKVYDRMEGYYGVHVEGV